MRHWVCIDAKIVPQHVLSSHSLQHSHFHYGVSYSFARWCSVVDERLILEMMADDIVLVVLTGGFRSKPTALVQQPEMLTNEAALTTAKVIAAVPAAVLLHIALSVPSYVSSRLMTRPVCQDNAVRPADLRSAHLRGVCSSLSQSVVRRTSAQHRKAATVFRQVR